MVLVYKMLDPTSEHRVWAYTASTVTAPIDFFLCCPALVSEFGRFLFSVCVRHLISCSHWLQTFSKLRAFWPSYLCSGIPFHSSNWQTEVFYFEDRLYGTLLVHYFQVKFQLLFAMPYCSILFVLSEQYSLSWRTSIVVCPNVQGEGSIVSLEHLQSTVLRRASVTSTSMSKIYCPSAIKPHLHGRLFCNAIRRFFKRENLSRRAATYTRRDSLTAIALGKNRRRVSKAVFTFSRCVPFRCSATCQRLRWWGLHSRVALRLLLLVTNKANSVKKVWSDILVHIDSCSPVADPENFGGGMIKILSTKPQKFGYAKLRWKICNGQHCCSTSSLVVVALNFKSNQINYKISHLEKIIQINSNNIACNKRLSYWLGYWDLGQN